MLSRIGSFILSAGVVLVFGACSSHQYSAKTRSLEKMVLENKVFSNNFTGVVFYNPSLRKTIYETNGDRYFTPASNIKLLTYYATSQILKDSSNAMEYSVLGDSLIFWGTGDPTFLNPDFDFQPAFKFLSETQKKLFFYPRNYEDERFGPGWAWEDYEYNYSIERAAFPIYGNRVQFTYKDSLESLNVIPDFFDNNLKIIDVTTNRSQWVSRQEDKNYFTMKKPGIDISTSIPFKYSTDLFLNLLRDTLNLPIEQIDFLPKGKVETIKGYPLDSIYAKMLQISDNYLAEQLIIMASNQMSDTLTSAGFIDYAEKQWLSELPDKLRWVDGSGLSRYNLATPRSFVKLLDQMKARDGEEYIYKILPAGGESGTIKNLYSEDLPYIFAKSGSFSNNYSLSGYLLTDKGNNFIFSLMTNHYLVGSDLIKHEIDKILRFVKEEF